MRIKFIILSFLFVGILTGCLNTDSPEQIAAYQIEEPIAIYSHSSESMLIYNATLDMEVSNVERATERAKEIAFEQGGYLVSVQSWYRDGDKHTTVVLAVPTHRFENTKDDLLRLGALTGEWISSELNSHSKGVRDIYAQITIYLHPKDSLLPEITLPKWRPVRTFQKALGVFVSIFGLLLDVVIWIAVVVGPFALIGWGIIKVYQWRRKPLDKTSRESES